MTIQNRPLILAAVLAAYAFLNTSTMVVGAPPTPLSSVAHDASLKGGGTTSSPLGIANGGVGGAQLAAAAVGSAALANGSVGASHLANGAVTAAAIAAGAAPTAGQVLTFNGPGLAWRTPDVSGNGVLRVLDSNGVYAGNILGGDTPTLWRQENGHTFFMIFDFNNGIGTDDNPTSPTAYYVSGNCSGTEYWFTGATSGQWARNGIVTYAIGIQSVTIASYRQIDGQCVGPFSAPGYWGLAGHFNVGAIGLVPPFYVQ